MEIFHFSGDEVKLATATLQSPSQASAVLTASGYIVAQRKAAVASKERDDSLSRVVEIVFKRSVISRIDDSDIRAQLEQAKANVKMVPELKDSRIITTAIKNY